MCSDQSDRCLLLMLFFVTWKSERARNETHGSDHTEFRQREGTNGTEWDTEREEQENKQKQVISGKRNKKKMTRETGKSQRGKKYA